jgi:hemerythrin
MNLITWSDNMSVNIKSIDEEHKILVNMINDLHSAMGSGKGKAVMGKILTGLADYTKTHFAFEENLMQKNVYPGYLAHKGQHDALTKQVNDLYIKFTEGKAVVTVEVMHFLKNWLTDHIQNTDKKYAPFLSSKGVV